MNKKCSPLRLVLFLGVFLLFTGCAGIENWLAEDEDVFNPATVRTIKGSISEVREFESPQIRGGGDLKLVVSDPEKEDYTVNLGPVWYSRRLNISFQEDDDITVIGSLVDDGSILVQEIYLGKKKYTYRDEMGRPKWHKKNLFNLSPGSFPMGGGAGGGGGMFPTGGGTSGGGGSFPIGGGGGGTFPMGGGTQ